LLAIASKNIIVAGCMMFACFCAAQNLVENPSFETFIDCPERLGNFDADVIHWSAPTDGSTDYFNGCSKTMGTPENFNGRQPADFGKGYAGLYLYAPNDYREYLQATLTKTLVLGKKYRVSFYVSLAERSDFAVKDFGVLFSKDKMEVPSKKELSKKKLYSQGGNTYNFMEIGYSNFYSDTQDWILVNTQFIAKGTENYMTIGNFKNNARTRRFKTKRNAKQGAYYYVDMFRVEAVADPNFTAKVTKGKRVTTDTFALDEIHVFENLLFEFDKFRLQQPAQQEMMHLFEYINADTSLQITIHGHTDGIGPERYNQVLSSKRAKAVANYLQDLGLSKDRIVWRGLGGEKPIATNGTEAGRQQNRRVEFVITKTDQLIK